MAHAARYPDHLYSSPVPPLAERTTEALPQGDEVTKGPPPPPAGSLLFWVRRAGALISNVNAAGIAQGGSTTTQ
ncbi:unannotated protein [freshwater metagenome]|uniref:Unannotated protein n=1 Tax=freshwater metagenome TaxID=449393 RepID=A0A6J7PMQ1_9ZZZZ